MIVLSTLRYGEDVSCAVLRQLDTVPHKGVRLALGTFVICRTENLLCEGRPRKVGRNQEVEQHKIGVSNTHKHRPSDQTIFHEPEQTGGVCDAAKKPTTAEYMGETQIDIRRIKMLTRYDRPPWKPVDEKQYDVKLSAFGPGTSSERYRTEKARTLEEDYGKHVKIYTDGLKMGHKMGYAIVKEEHTNRK
jgi:hypothetical protein